MNRCGADRTSGTAPTACSSDSPDPMENRWLRIYCNCLPADLPHRTWDRFPARIDRPEMCRRPDRTTAGHPSPSPAPPCESPPRSCDTGPVFGTMSTSVVVELNLEAAEVADMSFPHIGNHIFLRSTLCPRPDHDRCAMRIVRTHKQTSVTSQLLKTDPDVRLDVFHQMAKMNMAIGVRKCCCDKDLTS